ncbi:hypothetical protein DL98DRAFT_544437 [Cadophora sp. DSE1049]|nr:hypothetical protein DL98DRAFT_544437 [Cadophora sp. DSE1049]
MFTHSFTVAVITSLSLLSAVSNAQILPLNQFFNLTTFPNEQAENVTKYLNEAAALGTDGTIHQYFEDQCIVQHVYPPLFAFPPGFVKSFAAFDNFHFVGHSDVSAWAYDTGDGIVLIDTLDNQAEEDAILLPGLQSLDQFGSAVYASALAWEGMAAVGPTADPPVPTLDQTLIVLTTGHTPGTLSLIFPVCETNATHMAGLSGGTGTPSDQAGRVDKITSQNRFADISKAKGVYTLISNHQIADHSLFHADLLAHRPEGSANPFVIGVDNFEKYIGSMLSDKKVFG